APATLPAGWRLLFSDDFSGSSLNTSTWGAYGPNWPGNGGNGLRDGSAVSVGGGVLTITARMVGNTLVSGAVASRLNFTYGRISFRARTDPDPSQATSGVVLLWPQLDASWPAAGEDDIYETGNNPTRSWFSSFVHYGADNRQYWFGHDADATQWHQMVMDWTPSAIRFYRDGVLEGTVTDPAAIASTPHHLCIQLDAQAQRMGASVRMQVDDVAVYGPGG
ncbi:MAG TPA: glycoside hydrolase family 16 protein, partial [Solirubrobacteraceae bacterium]|nr:glycoside hydrolase family 16 protein [Solirubrobacteraceae bacterium]